MTVIKKDLKFISRARWQDFELHVYFRFSFAIYFFYSSFIVSFNPSLPVTSMYIAQLKFVFI